MSATLEKYVNGAVFSRLDSMLGVLSSERSFRRNARRVMTSIEREHGAMPGNGMAELEVTIRPYEHRNAHVERMRAYLETTTADDLVGAYVHGSLATGEEIPYSDFDALAIISADALRDEARLVRVGRALDGARSIMLDYDPLQHHGWFVLGEHELERYPEHYLPVEVLRHARVLVPATPQTLTLRAYRDARASAETFDRMTTSLRRRLAERRQPRNMYELKSLLSGVMLLPALYLQARDGVGVFKKDSFDRARADFAPETWRAMDEVSAIRAAWRVEVSPWRHRLLTQRLPLAHRLRKRLAPAIPSDLAARLADPFYGDVVRLIDAMRTQCATSRCEPAIS